MLQTHSLNASTSMSMCIGTTLYVIFSFAKLMHHDFIWNTVNNMDWRALLIFGVTRRIAQKITRLNLPNLEFPVLVNFFELSNVGWFFKCCVRRGAEKETLVRHVGNALWKALLQSKIYIQPKVPIRFAALIYALHLRKRMKLCKTCGGGRGLTTWEASLMSLGHSKYYASYTQSSRTLDMGFWKQFDHFHATPMVWNPFIIKAKRSIFQVYLGQGCSSLYSMP